MNTLNPSAAIHGHACNSDGLPLTILKSAGVLGPQVPKMGMEVFSGELFNVVKVVDETVVEVVDFVVVEVVDFVVIVVEVVDDDVVDVEAVDVELVVEVLEGELAKFTPLPLNGGGRGLTQHMIGSPSLISQTDCLRLA